MNGESVDDLWKRIGASYDWRWRQLSQGRIEVNVALTQPTDESIAPAAALEAADDPDRFDDFVQSRRLGRLSMRNR